MAHFLDFYLGEASNSECDYIDIGPTDIFNNSLEKLEHYASEGKDFNRIDRNGCTAWVPKYTLCKKHEDWNS